MEKYFFLIGGSKKYGSGKIIKYLKNYFEDKLNNFYFIETQKSRLDILISIIKIPRNGKILFQPSICFPAFIRDILIITFLRLRTKKIKFLLLVDICYKNPLLKYGIFKNIFFGNSKILSIANFSRSVRNQIKLDPFFEKIELKPMIFKNSKLPLALIHLGYLSKIKGWEDFQKLIKDSKTNFSAFAIGSEETKIINLNTQKIYIYKGINTKDIQTKLIEISSNFFTVLIFLSHEDFAPLILLESGFWGIPIACIRESRSHSILTRFLPKNCFIVVENIEQILNSNEELIKVRENMWNYVNSLSEEIFSELIYKELIN